ncbi:putative recombinase [Pseudescherichia vulneris NBRC 102420]|uniref:Putative recombinase n=1 Tax=Pseudescherichia vulneris NBRC 102420 TaxID=1115515 RepID=A0A090VRS7_PSEVU|nr:recombinase family protein [Pseudescherichia vulneris]GAL57842.1 putative recombinase [Pseudescherichia vulneris NBRC 102420]STQ58391.1 site-specific invertase; DLP12 prophage [Pseudescherichia vulneris]
MITKTAYCYCRVSTKHQGTDKGGYGMSRQQNLLMNYVDTYRDQEKLGYSLSTESVVFLNAEGVSGFSGKNLAPGSVLLNFIEDIRSGRIKNAVLCLENIDRWSRTNPQTAALMFLQLIESGCNIHEAENEIVHHKHSDLNLISSGLIRSHKESLRKQRLSLKNWDKRFDNVVKNNAVLTGRCPSWLRVENNEYIELPEHTKSIRLIFELYNKGFGQAYIREELNKRGWLYNNKTWGDWNVHRILNDIRVTGKHRTQSDLRKHLDGISLYPVIISDLDYNTAQQRLKSPGRNKKINKRANTIFAGIMMCGVCNSAHILLHTDGTKRFGRCSYSLAGNERCKARGFKYEIIENAIIEHMRHFHIETLGVTSSNEEKTQLLEELTYYSNYRNEVLKVVDAVDIPSERDYRILTNIENKIREIEIRIEELKLINNIDNDFDDVVKSITPELADVSNIALRQEFNIKLRKIIKVIKIIKYDKNLLIAIEYLVGGDVQWLNIDSSTGELHRNTYIEDGFVNFKTNKGMVTYDSTKNTYSMGDDILTEDKVKKLLSEDN